MCYDLLDCVRSIMGLFALVMVPTVVLYLLWLTITT